MEIEIRDINDDHDNIVEIVYFIPDGFNGKPLMGNCKYTALSNLSKINCHDGYVELVSHMTPIVKKMECRKLLILSDNPDGIVVGDDCILIIQ